MQTTHLFTRLGQAVTSGKYRYFGLQGGTSSSKTWSDIQIAILSAEQDTTPTLTSVVAESVPHLKRGAIKDFFTILDTDKNNANWNSTDMKYMFSSGSVMEFFSADDASKLRGARRDRLILNEANNLAKQAATQLMIRTKEWIIADWNPEVKFWWHDEIMRLEDAWFDISTHFDNPYLDSRIRKAIEDKKETDPEWYRVYGEGQIGQYEGIVFKNWEVHDLSKKSFPHLNNGLDFGFSPDPNALTRSYYDEREHVLYVPFEYVVDKLTDRQLAEQIKPIIGRDQVFCDRDLKAIRAFRNDYDINATGSPKPPGSRDYGIKWLASLNKIIIDKSCKNLEKELSCFQRRKDKNGEILPIFQDGDDHSLDSLRYGNNRYILGRSAIKTERLNIL